MMASACRSILDRKPSCPVSPSSTPSRSRSSRCSRHLPGFGRKAPAPTFSTTRSAPTEQADLTSDMAGRINALARYAASTGADGILFTCSAFGKAIEDAARQVEIPVLKPNEAMFQAALAMGDDIGMLATFVPAVAGMEEEFRTLAAEVRRPDARIRTICVPEAMSALQAGDAAAHNRLLAKAAAQLRGCDVVLLGQFSMARAEAALKAEFSDRILTSPGAAVARLRQRLAGA